MVELETIRMQGYDWWMIPAQIHHAPAVYIGSCL